MENLMVMEYFNGETIKFMKDNGKMELNTVQECGKVQKETLILANGKMAKLMGMVFIHGLTVIDIKVNF
jgi:hypothetical protein